MLNNDSMCSSSTVTPASDCRDIFPSFRCLVCFTFNFSSNASFVSLSMLLTFLISLSASSCDSAQSTVASAYLRLQTIFPPNLIYMSPMSSSRITDSECVCTGDARIFVGGATRPNPPSLASVVYTCEAVVGSWGIYEYTSSQQSQSEIKKKQKI